jgi:hypothetical protein
MFYGSELKITQLNEVVIGVGDTDFEFFDEEDGNNVHVHRAGHETELATLTQIFTYLVLNLNNITTNHVISFERS